MMLESPFAGIWIRPRSTIRAIVDRNPRQAVIELVVLAAVLGALGGLATPAPTAFKIGSHSVSWISPHGWFLFRLGMLVGSPLLAIALLYIYGALLRWSGALLGGIAKAVEVRSAIAWPMVLGITSSTIYLLAIPTGLVMPHGFDPKPSLHAAIRPFTQLGGLFLFLTIWQFVVYFKCIAEVHRFSFWRAIAAWLLMVLVFVGIGAGTVVVIGIGAILLLGH